MYGRNAQLSSFTKPLFALYFSSLIYYLAYLYPVYRDVANSQLCSIALLSVTSCPASLL